MGKNIGKNISKRWSGKYSQKLLDHAKNSATNPYKVSSKRDIEKTAEASLFLIQKQLQMSIIRKYLKKDLYLQKKRKKILMN